MQHHKHYLIVLLLVALVSFVNIEAVDRAKFKTCSQSSFCNRNRDKAPNSSAHSIERGTITTNGNKFQAEISNPEAPHNPLTLEIFAYSDSIIRLKINEKNQIKPRYEVQDVVNEGLKEIPFQMTSESGASVLDFGSGTKLRINDAPIRFDLYKNNDLYISANSRGLFTFEHMRKKEAVAPVEGEEAATEIREGEWEESFGSHKDNKPFGPTAIGMDFSFPGSENVYGIPEHATDLSLKPTKGQDINSDPYRLYNLDVFEYELDVPMALYGAVPLMISHDSAKTTAVLWLNAAETFIDVSKGNTQGKPQMDSHWLSESGIVDVFFFTGPSPYDIFRQYASVTGTISLPPMFSIAYHQCRWNYKDEADVERVDSGFDEHDIPYDVIWLDIEHTDSKKYFTWDKNYFPTPERMQEKIAAKQRKMVTIVDPHIKRDQGYYIHTEATAKGFYVKDYNGNDYEGWCWPGSSSWLDFVNPTIRAWWADQFSYSAYKGSSNILYTWNDMNEPSVFNGPEVTMHKDAKHFGNLEHRDIHNMFGYYMHMATWNGLLERNPGKSERPFLLTRAFYAGSQRYGAVWTGDNAGQWSHLAASQPMLLSLGLSGITFSGADVGGFFGNPDAELLTRWYQAGAFQPFFRGHAHLDTKRREPWLFGEPYTAIIRNAIRTRYTLLPYWYTIFQTASVSGIPIMRPLWVEFPSDLSTFAMQDQFMVGNALLVKPVVASQQSTTQVYLPGDQPWYEFNGVGVHAGSQTISVSTPLEKIPVFQRGGTIIPKKERARRSSTLMANDPFTLVVALNNKGEAEGELYVDDGHSFNYKNKEYLRRSFSFKNGQFESKSTEATQFTVPNVVERIVILGYSKKPTSVSLKIDGQNPTSVSFEYDSTNKVLLLRKPEAPIAKNFVIEFN